MPWVPPTNTTLLIWGMKISLESSIIFKYLIEFTIASKYLPSTLYLTVSKLFYVTSEGHLKTFTYIKLHTICLTKGFWICNTFYFSENLGPRRWVAEYRRNIDNENI